MNRTADTLTLDTSGGFRSWFWGYFVTGLLWFGVELHKQQQVHEERQRATNESVQQIRDAVRQGQAGEAFRRLFPQEHREFVEEQDRKRESP